jgi:hypothetical protein
VRGGFATFTGVGTMTDTISGVARGASAAFAGVGALTGNTSGVARGGFATFAGAGSLFCDIQKVGQISASANFAGAGSMSPKGTLIAQPVATFSGAGSLVPGDGARLMASAAFTGAGSITAVGLPQQFGSLNMVATGSLVVTTDIPFQHAFGNFAGAGRMTVDATRHLRVERHTGGSHLIRHAA